MKILIKEAKNGKWVEVESVSYKVEADLQTLIANSPSIIPVEEIMNGAPPFVLGVREFGLPGSGNTDILLFNEDGNIGVIECKLASNAEIKRKVIGQILEYAAYLWTTSYEDLDAKVKTISGSSLAESMKNLAEKPDWDPNQFREDLQQNLQNGTFNLIVAVDHINEELKRTIDYLNECGNTAFSFHALELHKYTSGSTEMLVPHMYGKIPQDKPLLGGSRFRSEEGFLEHAETNVSSETFEAVKGLLDWAKENADRVFWGRGKTYGSYTFHYLREGKTVSVFTVTSIGMLYFNFGYLSKILAVEEVQEFYKKLQGVKVFARLPENYRAFPSIPIEEIIAKGADGIEVLKQATLALKA
jgi:hypothetical protein